MRENTEDLFGQQKEYKQLAEDIIEKALSEGADQADLYIEWGFNSKIQVRLNSVESIKQSYSKGLGLRVFKNNRLGFSSTTDFSKDTIEDIILKSVKLSDIGGKDEFYGLPEKKVSDIADLDIFDVSTFEMSTDRKIDIALEMESSAFDYDKRIKNSEGAAYKDSVKGVLVANSNGFNESFFKSNYSMICEPVAESGDEKRVNYWYSSSPYFSCLETGNNIGSKAAERTVRMLGAKKIRSEKMPVVFDQLVASDFVGTIMACVNGEAKNKKETCLWDKLNTSIAGESVTVLDKGDMKKGIGSVYFDGEGVPSLSKKVVDKGDLVSFLYNTYSAKKGKTRSTGNGSRSFSSLPGIRGTNFFLENGTIHPDRIIANIDKGIYITGLIGFGVNIVNGNYSRGAEGIMIEKGELTFPVHEITISGNIIDMLQGIESVGNDLVFRNNTASPTILIREMMISGK
ncbi:TldD/PmbA family protein [candidate division KSB1 bacterium]